MYGILSLFCMFGMIAISYLYKDMQNPLYSQNQMVNEDGAADYGNNFNNQKDQVPEISNAVNPMMMDTNFYYQPSNKNDKNSTKYNAYKIKTCTK